MKTNREKLSEVLEKRGYKNEDLINEIEQIYSNQQLPIQGVVSSAKTCACGSGQTNFHKKIGCRECC